MNVFCFACCKFSLSGKGEHDMDNYSKSLLLNSSPIEDRELWNAYLENKRNVYTEMKNTNCDEILISEANWTKRHLYPSGENLGLHPSVGDICYMDFGQNYLNEIGYQHFGIIMNMYVKKALVIPMTSNAVQYETAYDSVDNPNGKKHLMRLGRLGDMAKPSVLFLNDIRFVNTARIISIVAHLNTDSELFWRIEQRMLEVAFVRPKVNFGISRYLR